MRWLGDHKDAVEEALFRRRRDLCTDLSLAFFDPTSRYFEGQGGESLGQLGYSKDHRPDRRQRTRTTSELRCKGWLEKRSKPPGSMSRRWASVTKSRICRAW
jgi:hypothetical protein